MLWKSAHRNPSALERSGRCDGVMYEARSTDCVFHPSDGLMTGTDGRGDGCPIVVSLGARSPERCVQRANRGCALWADAVRRDAASVQPIAHPSDPTYHLCIR